MTLSPALRASIARTTFNGGALYNGIDGRALFVMSGNSDTVDVWENVGLGRNVRVGEMTCSKFADLIGRPRVPTFCFKTRRWRDARGRFCKAPAGH